MFLIIANSQIEHSTLYKEWTFTPFELAAEIIEKYF